MVRKHYQKVKKNSEIIKKTMLGNSINIPEVKAKNIFKSFGTPVAGGTVIFSLDEAETAIKSLPGPVWVVKSQMHGSERGKGVFKELIAGTT